MAAIGQQITDNISWELFFFYFHCLSSSKMITLASLFKCFSQDITPVALVKSNKQVLVALLKSNNYSTCYQYTVVFFHIFVPTVMIQFLFILCVLFLATLQWAWQRQCTQHTVHHWAKCFGWFLSNSWTGWHWVYSR